MRNLAIDCAGMTPSVGLFEGDICTAFEQAIPGENSLCSLSPLIQKVLDGERKVARSAGSPPPIDLISITYGPGSFTGLRIGLATAKALAYAWGVPAVGIDTLDCLANQAAENSSANGEKCFIVPVLNAFRKQVFSAVWKLDGQLKNLIPTQVRDLDAWCNDPTQGNDEQIPIRVLGRGLQVAKPYQSESTRFCDEELWNIDLQMLAQLGKAKFELGEVSTAEQLLPNYIRASAAEEKR
ncbi:MAG: tRNA (adenosine(37)-N6)-threonylcarbamoyltransferase complex dimerization subunit type 1 TsaB [Planctomycetota bacterium]